MTRHFRTFVKRKYGNRLPAVRQTWQKKLGSWDDIRVPGRERLQKDRSTFRTGKDAAWTLDYVKCHHRLVAETLISFCRSVKQASKGKLATGAFHGYFFNTPWRDEGGHLEFFRVVKSPWVDYLAAPQIYDVHARDMGGTGLDRSLVGTILKHGKLWFSEADTPTHIGRTMKQYWKTREEIAVNVADSIALVRRDAARALTGRHSLWWFDFGRHNLGGEYLHPSIMADIKKMVKLSREVSTQKVQPVAQAALAYDAASPYHLAHWRSGSDSVSSGLTDQLVREAQYIGAPVDNLLWQDIEARHKLVVVANAFYLDKVQQQRLKKKVCAPGRIVLWMYAPGALGSGNMAAGISKTTGIRVSRIPGSVRPAIRFTKNPDLLTGIKGSLFTYKAAPVWMEKDADLPAPARLTPAFRVADREAEPLAYWAGTRYIALALKQEKWGLSVFCGLPLVPRRFLHNLLKAAGGHIYCTGSDVWLANSRVLAVHTRKGGKRKVKLPQTMNVMDGTSGRTVARKVRSFTVTLPKRSTSIWVAR
jgi:hypothetical protein